MSKVELKGGCLCGSIKYVISSPPLRAYTCHCKFCQKAMGAAFRAAIAVTKSSIALSGNSLSTYKYVNPDHGRALSPLFCSVCGTNIGTTVERFPDVYIINIGTLDDANDIDVSTHLFSDESLHWVTYKPTDTVFHQHRLNSDGSPAIPKNMVLSPQRQHEPLGNCDRPPKA